MEYILIKIDGEHFISNSLSIEIIAMTQNNEYYLVPMNQYIMGYRAFDNINYLIKNYTDKNTDIIIEFSPNYQDIKINFGKSTKILTYKEDIINGIQKFRINTNNKEISLNINKPERILNGNYLFRYYFLKNNNEFEYKFAQYSYKKKKINDEYSKADICLEFNKFEIYYNKTLVSYNITNINMSGINKNEINDKINSKIRLKIYGLLHKSNNAFNGYNELLNTSTFILSEFSYENKTEINYLYNNKFEICFDNMDKKDYLYDMQIKINIIFTEYFFKEDYLVFTLPINLTDEFVSKKDENNTSNLNSNFSIFLLFLIIIIFIILLIFIIMYFKLRKKNKNLEKLAYPTSISLNSIDSEEIFMENPDEKKSEKDYAFV